MSESRRRIIHELKTWPEFFEQTRNGRKRFELRRNDRDFRVGDQLLLKEWDPDKTEYDADGQCLSWTRYTGSEVLMRVDYIMDANTVDSLMGIHPSSRLPSKIGYVIMSISHIN